VTDRYASVPITLSDPLPGFQGYSIVKSRKSRRGQSYYRTLIGNHT